MSYKSKIIALAIIVTSLACSNSKIAKDNSNSYKLGSIYIGKQEYLDSLDNVQSNDVLILDDRDRENDPDMKIFDSYKIVDDKIMDEIINEIISYEEKSPSKWDRTYDSMKYEWIVHNFAYYVHYERERSKDVDFNNNDELKYSKNLVKSNN